MPLLRLHPGSEVRDGRRRDRLLDLHLGRHRRHLLRGEDEGWPSPGEKGGPKHAVSLAGQIERAVRHRAGLEVHPHLFRHIAAKLLL